MKQSIREKMEQCLQSLPAGEVVAISDFCWLATPKTVSKNIERLCENTGLTKLYRGIFIKGDRGDSPNPRKVALALARENNWQIVPSGETALHCAGLGDTPRVWTFLTDGTYRNYVIGEWHIQFRHSSSTLFSSLSEKTLLWMQVIRAGDIRKDLKKIQVGLEQLSRAEKDNILKETKSVTGYVAEILRKCLLPPKSKA